MAGSGFRNLSDRRSVGRGGPHCASAVLPGRRSPFSGARDTSWSREPSGTFTTKSSFTCSPTQGRPGPSFRGLPRDHTRESAAESRRELAVRSPPPPHRSRTNSPLADVCEELYSRWLRRCTSTSQFHTTSGPQGIASMKTVMESSASTSTDVLNGKNAGRQVKHSVSGPEASATEGETSASNQPTRPWHTPGRFDRERNLLSDHLPRHRRGFARVERLRGRQHLKRVLFEQVLLARGDLAGRGEVEAPQILGPELHHLTVEIRRLRRSEEGAHGSRHDDATRLQETVARDPGGT